MISYRRGKGASVTASIAVFFGVSFFIMVNSPNTASDCKSVLVIDNNKVCQMVLEDEFASSGYKVLVADSPLEGIDLASKAAPDIITIDLSLNGVSGIDVINTLQQNDSVSDIPIVVVTGLKNRETRRNAIDLGVVKIFNKPFSHGELSHFVDVHIRSSLSSGQGASRRILLVEDSETIRGITKFLLEKQNHFVIEAADGIEGWNAIQKEGHAIDLIVTDINMPNMNGQELVEKIRADKRFQYIPIIVSTTIAEKENIKLLLNIGADDYVVKPFSSEEFLARIDSHVRVKGLYEELHHANSKLSTFNETLEKRVEERTTQLREANIAAIYSLAMAAEAKDDVTGNHVFRIQQYTQALAIEIGLPKEEADEIGYSAIMHDVGKISIPDEILKKPGKLTKEEFDTMKGHTIQGERILPESDFFKVARDIARSHHEKWNGSGYPHGLKGEEIPLVARLAAVADVFDALMSERIYKAPWTIEDAMQEVIGLAGSHFDPHLVNAWEKLYKSGEVERIMGELK